MISEVPAREMSADIVTADGVMVPEVPAGDMPAPQSTDKFTAVAVSIAAKAVSATNKQTCVGSDVARGQVQEHHGDDGHVRDPQAGVGIPGAPQPVYRAICTIRKYSVMLRTIYVEPQPNNCLIISIYNININIII